MYSKYFLGKVVVITGATSGIGAATAVEFAKEGARLVIHGRNETGLKETKKNCVRAGLKEQDVAIAVGSLDDDAVLDLIVKKTLDTFGKIDVLYNNAGSVHPGDGPIQSTGSVDALDYQYKMCVRVPYLLTQKFVPELTKSKGVILFTSSTYSNIQDPALPAYCIMKSAQDQMSKVFAMSLAMKGIRVNSIRPGTVRTNAMKRNVGAQVSDQLYAMMEKTVPLEQTLASSEDLAKVVVFLASGHASCLTSNALDCDRGWSHTFPTVDFTKF